MPWHQVRIHRRFVPIVLFTLKKSEGKLEKYKNHQLDTDHKNSNCKFRFLRRAEDKQKVIQAENGRKR